MEILKVLGNLNILKNGKAIEQLLDLLKVIAKLTKTKKDDELIQKIDDILHNEDFLNLIKKIVSIVETITKITPNEKDDEILKNIKEILKELGLYDEINDKK